MPAHDDLYGSPWQTPEEREAKRRVRHKLWIDSLTDRDWARIGALVDAGGGPRIEDLDAPGIAVGVAEVSEQRHYSGERIGELKGWAVLVWRK